MDRFICDVLFPLLVLMNGVHFVTLYEMIIINAIVNDLIAQSLGPYHPFK